MNALILSVRRMPWVAGYFPDFSMLTIPLAGKPFVEHQLDWCSRRGVKCVRILYGAYSQGLAERLGDGSRWGLRITCVRIPNSACDEENLIRENEAFLGGDESLVIRAGELEYGGKVVGIGSLRDYFEMNFTLLDDPKECVLPGYYSEHGVNLGMNVQLRMGCQVDPPVLLDDNSRIDHNCRLNGEVIVGEGSIIDRGARLHRAIVFPRTYVARQVELENKIVAGTCVIDPLTGGSVNLTGDVLSADLRGNGRGFFRRLRRFLRFFRRKAVHDAT